MDVSLTEVQVRKLNVQPGDVLAVNIKCEDIDHDQIKQIRDEFKKVFPNNEVMVIGFGLEDDMDIEILRPLGG